VLIEWLGSDEGRRHRDRELEAAGVERNRLRVPAGVDREGRLEGPGPVDDRRRLLLAGEDVAVPPEHDQLAPAGALDGERDQLVVVVVVVLGAGDRDRSDGWNG
jgi:hypothetical protein